MVIAEYSGKNARYAIKIQEISNKYNLSIGKSKNRNDLIDLIGNLNKEFEIFVGEFEDDFYGVLSKKIHNEYENFKKSNKLESPKIDAGFIEVKVGDDFVGSINSLNMKMLDSLASIIDAGGLASPITLSQTIHSSLEYLYQFQDKEMAKLQCRASEEIGSIAESVTGLLSKFIKTNTDIFKDLLNKLISVQDKDIYEINNEISGNKVVIEEIQYLETKKDIFRKELGRVNELLENIG